MMSLRNILLILFMMALVIAVWMLFHTPGYDSTPVEDVQDEVTMNEENPSRDEAHWKKVLSAEQYRILREAGTERAFTGKLLHEKRTGNFLCAACSAPLFHSDSKYDSGSGWPSFYETFDKDAIAYHEDYTLYTKRVEVRCAKCGSHMGHVFDDGPAPTGKRYCINSLAMTFEPVSEEEESS